MTQTKIIATLGPASDSPEMIRGLIEAGVDVFRINFSHGEPQEHRRQARTVRSIAGELGRDVALLGDIAGPKLRCGRLSREPLELATGAQVTLTSEDVAGDASRIHVSYDHLHEDVQIGQDIALDDGRIRLQVESVDGRRVLCRVTEGGALRSHKGVNLPDTTLQIGAITNDDRRSIALTAEEGFDFLGLSFVGSASDVALARSIVAERGADLALIAKIERRSAVEGLDTILDEADGAMVARGDLGVELPIERVPLVQKQVIRACNHRAIPVITATQMLESMARNRRPTRAEVTDIANAILDGSDAVMLSGETAIGDYPLETVRTMDRVARTAEKAIDHNTFLRRFDGASLRASEDAEISQAASELALDLNLDAIVCLTEGGSTPRRIARHRPACPIVAVSANRSTVRQMVLSWGVEPLHVPVLRNPPSVHEGCGPGMETWMASLLDLCVEARALRPGQRVVIVAGLPLGRPGNTNLIHLTTVGDNPTRAADI